MWLSCTNLSIPEAFNMYIPLQSQSDLQSDVKK